MAVHSRQPFESTCAGLWQLKYVLREVWFDTATGALVYQELQGPQDRSIAQQLECETLRDSEDFLLKAVTRDGTALRYASDKMKNNKGVVLRAVEQNGWALQYASDELRGEPEVVLRAVRGEGMALQYASEALRGDREVVLRAVTGFLRGQALRYASPELRGDREVVLAALSQDGSCLQFASNEMRGDREVVYRALAKSHGMALQYASSELRCDREVVRRAVERNGMALQFAAQEMRADRKIVFASAVRSNAAALQFASVELRCNAEALLKAVGQDGAVLPYASEELLHDATFMKEALRRIAKGGKECMDAFVEEHLDFVDKLDDDILALMAGHLKGSLLRIRVLSGRTCICFCQDGVYARDVVAEGGEVLLGHCAEGHLVLQQNGDASWQQLRDDDELVSVLQRGQLNHAQLLVTAASD
mmetsp:Transcript_73894/g.175887  ORF Transcript_73894/g.175887 Transcript_73894/m.175887 type:complete len:420 (+) Transcript_73894:217-1476(+)